MAIAALVAVTAIWGLTFATVKEAITQVPPYEFLAIRFTIAFMTLVTLFPTKLRNLRGPTLPACGLVGSALAVGYGFQTVGLKYTSATNGGFVTGLFVVFTPLVAALWLRTRPSWASLALVAVAAAGLALLTLSLATGFRHGDALILVTAVAFAVHIVLLGHFAPLLEASVLALGQIGVCAIAFIAISLATETYVRPAREDVWFALLLTGVAASAVGFLVQTWAQSKLPPTRTAVVLTMEPVFAGVFGFLLLGETLSVRGWLGAAMILAAMLVASNQRFFTEEFHNL